MKLRVFLSIALGIMLIGVGLYVRPAIAAEESGSLGLEGVISAPPPSQGATIAVPNNGQVFTSIPITVSGLCPSDTLVKLFKNNVFSGSVQCNNGSYSITIDLFRGTNELVARVFDALDQAGPDSNIVTVTYVDNRTVNVSRPTLTSNFAKRGANPKETLDWPIILSGGEGPYAISVDWGDGKPPDLFTREFPGPFNISHIYDNPGVYNIIIRASDRNDNVAFLQLVGVANGPLSQTGQTGPTEKVIYKTKVFWLPLLFVLPFLITSFWLGNKYAINVLKRRAQLQNSLE